MNKICIAIMALFAVAIVGCNKPAPPAEKQQVKVTQPPSKPVPPAPKPPTVVAPQVQPAPTAPANVVTPTPAPPLPVNPPPSKPAPPIAPKPTTPVLQGGLPTVPTGSNALKGADPLPPEIIKAPKDRPCLQWKVVKRKKCRPKVVCSRTGGTCHQVRDCRRVRYTRIEKRRSCDNHPRNRYIVQKVCKPRIVTSMTVKCHNKWVTRSTPQLQCRNVQVVRTVSKQQCQPGRTICTNKQVCTTTPRQVCTNVPTRKMVRQCRMVNVRVNRPRQVCGLVTVKKFMPQRVCTKRRATCRNQQDCRNVTRRVCRPVRTAISRPQCRNVTTYRVTRNTVCRNVPIRRAVRKRVCTKSNSRCFNMKQCGHPSKNALCRRNPRNPICRSCRTVKRCIGGGRPNCRMVTQYKTVMTRKCTPQMRRTPITRRVCNPVRTMGTKTVCSNIQQRKCTTRRICTPGQNHCFVKQVARMVRVNKCRMVAGSVMVPKQQCTNVFKTTMTRRCTVQNQRNCTVRRVCKPGGTRCFMRPVAVTTTERRCKRVNTVRRVQVRDCHRVPVKRRLTSCRMERRWVTTMVRHCEVLNTPVTRYKTVCQPGVRCTPGVEQCRTERVCRTKYKQVCAAW